MPQADLVLGGREFDWYACDLSGELALFSTAGSGSIPEFVFSSSVEYPLLDAFFSLDRGALRLVIDRWGTPEALADIADRGFHVFDWDGECYRKIASPRRPQLLCDATQPVQSALRHTKLNRTFRWADSIHPNDL